MTEFLSNKAGPFLGWLLGGFNRVAIFAKIMTLEFFGFFMLARFTTNFVFDFFPLWGNPEGTTKTFDFYNILFLVLGGFFSFFCFRRIFWARVEAESFIPTLKINLGNWTLITANPVLAPLEFSFATTHPLYFFVDLLPLGAAAIIGYVGLWDSPFSNPENKGVNFFCYSLFFCITLSFTSFRILSWYALKRRIILNRDGVWHLVIHPLLSLYSIYAFIGLLTVIVSYCIG